MLNNQAELHGHAPVLPEQVVSLLSPESGQSVLDCTLGRGGHASLLIPKIGPGGVYVGLDRDADNLAYAQARLAPIAEEHGVTLHTVHASFVEAGRVLADLDLEGVDMLFADLGFASNQVDDAERGLSFMRDGPLDMRLDPSQGETAADLVARLSEVELADVIYRYGEERLSRRIARRIVYARQQQAIETTGQLAQLIKSAVGGAYSKQRIHPATRSFQALRIAVNGEIDALEALLAQIPNVICVGGRVGMISFHSLEDRPVKLQFREWAKMEYAQRVTRKPAIADEQECSQNSRSRSAKWRVIRWLGPEGVGMRKKIKGKYDKRR